MGDAAPDAGGTAPCPLCGAPAERGCVYGPDNGPLRWAAGPPSFLANVGTGSGGGELVGGWGFWAGPHAEGTRCGRCRRIVLAY